MVAAKADEPNRRTLKCRNRLVDRTRLPAMVINATDRKTAEDRPTRRARWPKRLRSSNAAVVTRCFNVLGRLLVLKTKRPRRPLSSPRRTSKSTSIFRLGRTQALGVSPPFKKSLQLAILRAGRAEHRRRIRYSRATASGLRVSLSSETSRT